MSVLKNARHERFAQIVASGKTQADAYRTVFPASRKWKDDNAVHSNASQMRTKVAQRVAEIQAASAEKITITKARAINILADALTASPKDVNSDSKFAQEMVVNPVTGQVTIRLPSKTAAFAELAKALGWYEPERIQQEVRIAPDPDTLNVLRR